MDPRKFILRETLFLILGQVLCIAAMIGVFALLGHLDYKVILGGIIGGILAVGNFFFMAIVSDAAADKAKEQDVKTGSAFMKTSYRMRLVVLGVLLFVFAKSGHCNILALACPLFFVFPIIMVIEFFRKAGGTKA
ncbi:MAG: ATP synthase subunit I [Oscillospiraceae bacterium]|nr:ATP synthase subunit I [Oscillospiraceae bacterium]